jgi:hypothetical protein
MRCEKKGCECVFDPGSSPASSLTSPPVQQALRVAYGSPHQDHSVSPPVSAPRGAISPFTSLNSVSHHHPSDPSTRRLGGPGVPMRHGDARPTQSGDSVDLLHGPPAGFFVPSQDRPYPAQFIPAYGQTQTLLPHYAQQPQGYQPQPHLQPHQVQQQMHQGRYQYPPNQVATISPGNAHFIVPYQSQGLHQHAVQYESIPPPERGHSSNSNYEPGGGPGNGSNVHVATKYAPS